MSVNLKNKINTISDLINQMKIDLRKWKRENKEIQRKTGSQDTKILKEINMVKPSYSYLSLELRITKITNTIEHKKWFIHGFFAELRKIKAENKKYQSVNGVQSRDLLSRRTEILDIIKKEKSLILKLQDAKRNLIEEINIDKTTQSFFYGVFSRIMSESRKERN